MSVKYTEAGKARAEGVGATTRGEAARPRATESPAEALQSLSRLAVIKGV